MASLFISYSRKDKEAAHRLTESFKDKGLDFWIDWEGIPPTVDWWKEIERGIEEADMFLFLISPDSAQSKVCRQEIEYAAKNGKRLIPVVVRDIKADESPPELRSLNWIFVRETDDFTYGFHKLITAIKTDYAWAQAHRQLQVKALEWERNGHKKDFLLQGEELQDAESDLVTNSSKDPHPTDLQRGYVLQSRQTSDRQRRRLLSFVIGAAIVMAGLAVFGFLQAQLATTNARNEQAASTLANKNANTAQAASTQAIANEQEAKRQANAAIARQLAVQAQSLFVTGDSRQMVSVLLAVQSMKMLPDRNEEAMKILQTNSLAIPAAPMTHGTAVYSVAFSPDGKYVASGGCDQQDAQQNCTQGSVRVWDVATGKEIAHMTHADRVTRVAFSPDGGYVVSGSWDDTARVWQADRGEEVARLTHDSDVTSVAFSPDGKYVVSGAGDKSALWEAATGREITPMTRNESAASVDFSPDGKYVVSGSEDGSARVQEAATGNEVSQVTYINFVQAVAFSPDSKYVISGGCDETAPTALGICRQSSARVWEAASGNLIASVTHAGHINSVAFSPDGQEVVSGGGDGTVLVWEASTGREIARTTYDQSANSVAFSPDGTYVVSGSDDKTARVWEAATGREIARMTHDGSVTSVAFSPDGHQVVSASADGIIRIWKVAIGDRIVRMTQNGQVLYVAFSPDSTYLVAGGCQVEIMLSFCPQGEGIARVWNVITGEEVSQVAHENGVFSVAFSPDGKSVVSGGQEGKIKVWNAQDGQEIADMSNESEYEINVVDFSPDGKYVVSNSNTNTIRVWDAAHGTEIAHMTPDAYVFFVAFSPNGKYLLSGSMDGTARVWDAAHGTEIARTTYDAGLYSVAFSPDSRYVVSGGCDQEDTSGACLQGSARLWEAATGQEITRMTYDAAVRTAAFSPDGKYVVSTIGDQVVQVWEGSTGTEIARITEDSSVGAVAFRPDGNYIVSGAGLTFHLREAATGREIARLAQNNAATFAAFTRDGKYLVSLDGDNTIVAWLYRPEDLIADACSRVTRNLTETEWEQYIGEAFPYRAICP